MAGLPKIIRHLVILICLWQASRNTYLGPLLPDIPGPQSFEMCVHLAASGRLQWPPAAEGLHPPSTGLQLPAASSGQTCGQRPPSAATSVLAGLRPPRSLAAFGGRPVAFSVVPGRLRRPLAAFGRHRPPSAASGCRRQSRTPAANSTRLWQPPPASGGIRLLLDATDRLRRSPAAFSGWWPPSAASPLA